MLLPTKKVSAGTSEKGDVIIEIEPDPEKRGVSVNLKQLKISLFDKRIEEVLLQHCKTLGISDIIIHISDFGALDFTLRARLEAAIIKGKEADLIG